MHRGRNTLILLVVGLLFGGYVWFVEMKREPAPEPGAEPAGTKLFNVEPSKIEALTVKSSTGDRTTLKKAGDVWQIVEPTQATVDVSELSGLTTSLASLESSRVVDEKPSDLAKFGLDQPRIELSFRVSGEQADRQLLIGTKTPTGGDLYAKLANEPKVLLVPGYLETTFDRSTFQLRDKTMLVFDRDKVDTIELAHGAESMTFTKKGETWTMTEPSEAKTDSAAVEGLLGRLSAAQMKSMASTDPTDLGTYGLAKPESQVTLRAGSTSAGLLVGSASQDGGAYAKDTSRPLVFTIEKPLADDLRKTRDDFRLKDLLEFRPFTGTKMEITLAGGVTHTFEKKKGTEKDAVEKWTRTQPQPAGNVNELKIDDVAAKLADLRADTFVAELPKGATTFATITVESGSGAASPVAAALPGQAGGTKKTEQATIHQAGADYYATRANDSGALKLKAADVEALTKALDGAK